MTDKTQNLDKAIDALKAISNPVRLSILCALIEGEKMVGELSNCCDIEISQSALSQHLGRLRERGYVTTRKSKQSIYYSISSPEIGEILHTLHKIYCNDSDEQS